MRSKYHNLLKREEELDRAARERENRGREEKSEKSKDDKFNPFTFSGTEDKFDDDYEDFKGFIQVD